jgi:hypothetical protein
MCLIIRKPSGISVPREFIFHVAESNSHGWGFAYLAGNELITDKGLDLLEGVDAFSAIPVDREAVLHLRRATRGGLNPDLAHPFMLTTDTLLFHNGTLSLPVPNPQMSDTWELARLLRSFLQVIPPSQQAHFLRSEGFNVLLSRLIEGSMVVLMDHHGILSFGREWKTLSNQDFPGTEGLQVSNFYAWKEGVEPLPSLPKT